MFVEPSLRLRKKREKIEREPPFAKEKDPRIKEDPFIYEPIRLEEFIEKSKDNKLGYAIVADSGMGKTMLLEELAHRISAHGINSHLIPIFLEFSQLSNVNSSDDIIKIIRDEFSRENKIDDYIVKKWFEDKRFLFLIDGLDQVVGGETNFLSTILGKNVFFGNHMIFASRPFAYSIFDSSLSLSENYHYVEIDLFNETQIKKYLKEDYEETKQILSFSPQLLQIPILLSHIKVFKKENCLGDVTTKTDLYRKIIDKLFTHEKGRRIDKSYSKDDLIHYFKKLSFYTLSKGNIYRFPRSLSDEGLKEIGIDRDEFDSLLKFGIIQEVIEGDKEGIIYRHQSFQEYFASLQLKEKIFKNSKMNEDVIIEHLEYNYWDEVWLFLIGSLEEAQAKKIIEYIRKSDPYLAARSLADYKGKREDFKGLIDWLFSKVGTRGVRDILIKIVNPYIESKLIGLLKDKESYVRSNAAWALGDIKSEKTVEPLIELLKDKEGDVRSNAAGALGDIKSEKAVEPLIELLKDKDADVRSNAARALGEIKSEKAVEPLIELLKDKDADVRSRAAGALGEIKSEKAVELLMELLKDKESYVRSRAADGLGNIKSEKAVELLMELLKDKESYVRSRAADGLGNIKSEKAVEPLIELLKDKKYDVRLKAAEALGNISTQFNSDEQSKLVLRLKDKKDDYFIAITEIKTATGRRFLKELKGINLKEII